MNTDVATVDTVGSLLSDMDMRGLQAANVMVGMMNYVLYGDLHLTPADRLHMLADLVAQEVDSR